MKRHYLKTTLALAFMATTICIASADRGYLYMSPKHVYIVGPDANNYADFRQQVEEHYGEEVEQLQQAFDTDIANGFDPEAESRAMDQQLDRFEDERDQSLASVYPVAPAQPGTEGSPIFNDRGSCELVGVDYHAEGSTTVVDYMTVYKPYADCPSVWSRG